MKIISLLENTTSKSDMEIEHGLSLFIEADGLKILFDMGQSDLFYKNAKKLGVDLSIVDFAILSHGHYDHGGGISKFLEINSHAPIYIHKSAFCEHYNGTQKYIGLDCQLVGNERFIFTENEYKIKDGITLFSCNERERKYKAAKNTLLKKQGECFVADDFLDEQYLLIEKENKRVLISGCSHKGILNITDWFLPDTLVGGFHLSKLDFGVELDEIAKKLSTYKTEFYTCHCTGEGQYEFLKSHMKNLSYIRTGEEITI